MFVKETKTCYVSKLSCISLKHGNVNDYNQSNVNFENRTSGEDAHEKEARRLSPQKRCIYF